jgi:osmotically-inducible protein OsmY
MKQRKLIQDIEPHLHTASSPSVSTKEMSGLWQLSDISKVPSLVLVGSSMRVNDVATQLKPLGLKIIKVQYVKDMMRAIDPSVVGVIYVMPLKKSHVVSVHKNVMKQKRMRNFDFFAIAPNWVTARTERELYKVGIKMVFDWAKEKSSFETLFSKALNASLSTVRSNDTDTSLQHAISNRLKTSLGRRPQINVVVYHGIAMLRGEVETLQQKRKILKIMRRVPGLRGVVDQSLRVKHSSEERQQVIQRANRKMRNSYGVNHQTLDVSYDKKENAFVLSGTVNSRRELKDVLHDLESLHGVHRIINRAQVAPRRQKKDKFLAKRAMRAVKQLSLSQENQVQIKVQQGEALIKGRVHSTMELEHLTQMIQSMDGIHSVKTQAELIHG